MIAQVVDDGKVASSSPLDNGRISARGAGFSVSCDEDFQAADELSMHGMPMFGINPFPERSMPVAMVVVGPNGMGVRRLRRTSCAGIAGGGARGAIYGRSDESNRRLMERMMHIDMAGIAAQHPYQRSTRAVFVGLTYPGGTLPTSERAKRDLRALQKRLERAYNVSWGLWVQEFQRRGAIHYHVVIVFSDVIDLGSFRDWLTLAWYEVVGSGDAKHRYIGAHVVSLHFSRGAACLMSYLAKELAKGSGKSYQMMHVDAVTGEVVQTGRTWGFWHAGAVPVTVIAVAAIVDEASWTEFKGRVSRAFSRSRYLSSVASMVEWWGSLLYGDGASMIDELLSDLSFVFRELPCA